MKFLMILERLASFVLAIVTALKLHFVVAIIPASTLQPVSMGKNFRMTTVTITLSACPVAVTILNVHLSSTATRLAK